MNRKELEDKLNKMNEEEFKDFMKKLGGGHESTSAVVRAFVDDPKLEKRYCQVLDLLTEEEKRTQATIEAAEATSRSEKWVKYTAIAVSISVIISLILLFKK